MSEVPLLGPVSRVITKKDVHLEDAGCLFSGDEKYYTRRSY
jgi:hypothetical protein